MKTLLTLAAFAAIAFAGCSSQPPGDTPTARDKLAATGSVIGKRVASEAAKFAANLVINSAVSWMDGRNKADFLDSAAQGLRENMLSIVNANDVSSIVRIWTPADTGPSHWQELAGGLGQLYADNQTPGTRKRIVEALAQGLQLAAESERSP